MKNIQLDSTSDTRESWYHPWLRFWFAPADAIGLHLLRVMTGLLLLLWLLPLAGDAYALYSLGGYINSEVLQAQMDAPEDFAPIGWSILFLAGDNAAMFQAIYWLSIVIVLLFTAGIAIRITAVLAWVITASFLFSPVVSFDADHLLIIPTFYVMIAYLLYGQFTRPLSVAQRILGPDDAMITKMFSHEAKDAPESHAANFAVRLFQVHFAIVILTSFLHKTQMAEWWAGVAFFSPMHRPYQTTIDDMRALAPSRTSYFFLLSLAQYLMLAWQLAFPFIAWKKSFRWVLIGGGVVAVLGSIFIFGTPLFGPITLVACLAYLTPEEWRGIVGRFQRKATVARAESSLPRPRGLKEVKSV